MLAVASSSAGAMGHSTGPALGGWWATVMSHRWGTVDSPLVDVSDPSAPGGSPSERASLDGATGMPASSLIAKLRGQGATAKVRAELVRQQLEDARPHHRWSGCAPANPGGWFNFASLANRPAPWLGASSASR